MQGPLVGGTVTEVDDGPPTVTASHQAKGCVPLSEDILAVHQMAGPQVDSIDEI
jgi:hypothetical protein